jgi:hypothetical protein
MKSWFALLLSPAIALAAQSALYAQVTPSCASQSRLGLHASAAIALAAVLALLVLAVGDWSLRRAEPGGGDSDHGTPGATRRFLSLLAIAVSALSALVVAAMWFGLLVLSPCAPWP